tara:strand:+ start:2542 stop:2673 length:132 start_codon:yes stop_codon:yes gene_type:complete
MYFTESQGRAVIDSTNRAAFRFEGAPVADAIAKTTAKAAGTSG